LPEYAVQVIGHGENIPAKVPEREMGTSSAIFALIVRTSPRRDRRRYERRWYHPSGFDLDDP
jgi:hypothetical protein